MIEDKGIGYILHKASMAAKNDFTSKLNGYGITPGQLTVLNEIYNHKENPGDFGLSPACIADRMECDRPTISGIVDRLEAQEWIVRLQNPEDKRSCIIQLTDKAVNSLDELDKIRKENHDIILKGFTQEDSIMFKNYLLQVINNFKGMDN